MRIKDGDVGAREEFIKGKLRLLRKMSEMTRKQEVLHDRIKLSDKRKS